MKKAQTFKDLNAKFQKRVQKLTEEYDFKRLRAQTFADYMISLVMQYEREAVRINGGAR